MWRVAIFLTLAACSMIPIKKKGGSSSSSSAPAAPRENDLHWEKGTPIETLNDGDELFTEGPAFHWESQEARFKPGRKMSARTREAF